MGKRLVLIVSPHPDDVSFSLGGALYKRTFQGVVHVINLFSKQRYSILQEDDTNSFRRVITEERDAANLLRYRTSFEGFPEAAIRGYNKLSDIIQIKNQWYLRSDREILGSVYDRLKTVISRLRPSYILAPISPIHVDHRIVTEQTLRIWRRLPDARPKVFLYEDLPYCIDDPSLRLSKQFIGSLGFSISPHILSFEKPENKEKAIMIFRSQINTRQMHKIMQYSLSSSGKGVERIWSLQEHKQS